MQKLSGYFSPPVGKISNINDLCLKTMPYIYFYALGAPVSMGFFSVGMASLSEKFPLFLLYFVS